MHCAEKEKTANNCLVILVGISKFEKYTKIPDIDDVKDDICSYKSAFDTNPNVKIISNDINKIWTAKSLLKYFENCFNQYLYNDLNGNIRYNSLIITLSGHSTETSIICSNGEQLSFTKILSIFTQQWENKNLIANLPKFIFVDGQRGFDYLTNPINLLSSSSSSEEEEEEEEDEKSNKLKYEERDLAEILMEKDVMDSYSCIMCSISAVLDSSAYSGQLSWNLSQILKELFEKQQDAIFYDIVNKLRQRIAKASDYSDYQFSIDFIEHDMDIDDVIFTSKQSISLSKPSPTLISNDVGMDEAQLKKLVKQRKKEKKKEKKELKKLNKTTRFKRSRSLGHLMGDNKKNKDKKSKKKNKQKSNLFTSKGNNNNNDDFGNTKKSPLSPKRFFKHRTQSLVKSSSLKKSKSLNSKKLQNIDNQLNDKNSSLSLPENEETNKIDRDPIFKDSIEWDKSIEILSKSKDKTRVKIQWLFKLGKKSTFVTFNHSQKTNPYIKSKRVLSINGKQIWSQKSTATQFTQLFDGNKITITIQYDDNKKQFSYLLNINDKSHTQHFYDWQKQNMFVE